MTIRTHQEMTMSELSRKVFLAETAAVREHLAEQEQQATDKAATLLAPLEAKVRELNARKRAEHRAAVLREAIGVARDEACRLEEVAGIEVARGARCVAYLLRKLLAKEGPRRLAAGQPATEAQGLSELEAAARTLELDRDAAEESADYRRGMTRAVEVLRLLDRPDTAAEEQPATEATHPDLCPQCEHNWHGTKHCTGGSISTITGCRCAAGARQDGARP